MFSKHDSKRRSTHITADRQLASMPGVMSVVTESHMGSQKNIQGIGLAPTENHCLSLFLPACFPDALSVGKLEGAQSSLEARLFSSIERRPWPLVACHRVCRYKKRFKLQTCVSLNGSPFRVGCQSSCQLDQNCSRKVFMKLWKSLSISG